MGSEDVCLQCLGRDVNVLKRDRGEKEPTESSNGDGLEVSELEAVVVVVVCV